MKNYELAKQLRDAGFPFKDQRCQECIENHLSCDVSALPPLPELIEACGDNLRMLLNVPHVDRQKHEWEAFGNDVEGVFGSTPEEAVAKLWLELNNKK